MTAIKLTDFTARYRSSNFQLGPINLELPSGVVGVVGINGAGKSTLFGALMGNIRDTSGTVEFLGANPNDSIGFLPQNPIFPRNARCRDVLEFAAWLHGIKDSNNRIDDLERKLGLTEYSRRRSSELSGGMLRRLGVAQAIIHEPTIVLLDEPTAGLDPLQRVAVREVIQNELTDKTVLLSTHLVEDIRHLAQHVVVLDKGQVVFQGSVLELEQIAPADAIGESRLEQALNSLYLGNRK